MSSENWDTRYQSRFHWSIVSGINLRDILYFLSIANREDITNFFLSLQSVVYYGVRILNAYIQKPWVVRWTFWRAICRMGLGIEKHLINEMSPRLALLGFLKAGGSYRVLHAYRKRSLRYISLCRISSQRVAIASALLSISILSTSPPSFLYSSIFLRSLHRPSWTRPSWIQCICGAYMYFDGFDVYMGVYRNGEDGNP